jgi:predicted dehydrogenase
MINKKNLELLVVGVGSIGKRHIDNIRKFNEKIDIADISNKRLNECQKKFKFINNTFLNFKNAMNKKQYDAVFICTPPHKHLEIANYAIKRNINIFIEKPLGMNTRGWQKLANICKKNKIINYVGYCHRHINYVQFAKQLLDKKIIGKIISGNIRWGSYLPDWHPWEKYNSFYMAKKSQGGGALLDESHGIDLLRYLVGEAKEVFAIVDTISGLKITSDDNAFLTLRMKNNSLFHLNFDLHSRYNRITIELLGSNGNLIIDRVHHEVSYFNVKQKKWKKFKFSKANLFEMYPKQINYFLNCLTKKTKANLDIFDAIKTQKIIDGAFLSSKRKKTIAIK